MERLRAGFVGAGRIADLNALGWLDHPAGEIVAVCDVDAGVRHRRAAEWGATAHASLDELLADDAVDVVEILTPHHLHADQAVAALEAGKHVSLQKPPTRTLAELDRVTEAAARNPGTLRVYENFRSYPPHTLAAELIEQGEVGRVLSVRMVTAGGRLDSGQGWDVPQAANAWRMDPALCGGGMITFDHGYHCFQLGRMFVDSPVDTVHAFINRIGLGEGRELDLSALISWRYDDARLGSWEVVPSIGLDVASDYYVSDDRVEIRGSEGIIWINRCSGRLLEEPPVVLYREGVVRAFHRVPSDWSESFRLATHELIDALLAGEEPQLTAAEARETLVFALAAQQSASDGREVPLAELRG